MYYGMFEIPEIMFAEFCHFGICKRLEFPEFPFSGILELQSLHVSMY